VSSLDNKIDFTVILRVTHANPNGDPLNGNRCQGRSKRKPVRRSKREPVIKDAV